MDSNSINIHIISSVISFSLLVSLFYTLKKHNFIHEDVLSIFVKILMQIILPATIFGQLVNNNIKAEHFTLALAMIISGVVCLFLAYSAGKLLKLERPTIGALMISSAFGSSALFGYPLIKLAFPNDPIAFEDAVIISELGVGLPIFILAPLIAMTFGNKSKEYNSVFHIMITYFKSPIFISVVLGLGLSFLHLPFDSIYLSPFAKIFETLSGSMAIFACIILALELVPAHFKKIIPLIIISVVIQLFAEPYICSLENKIFSFSPKDLQILIFLSSMPSAVLGTVFASKYDCDSKTASTLVMANIILSVALVPVVNLIIK